MSFRATGAGGPATVGVMAPGQYEFKYNAAEGLPGASIYGELVVRHANWHTSASFQRRAFIPISWR